MGISPYMQLVRSDGTTEGAAPEPPRPELDASAEGVEILRELLRSGVDVETLPLEITLIAPGEEAGTERVEFGLGPFTLHAQVVECNGCTRPYYFFLDEWDATEMVFRDGGVHLLGDIRRRFFEAYDTESDSQS